jgi:hypothetical protein
MRFPPATPPTKFLEALLAAVPDQALRPLVLELIRNGAGARSRLRSEAAASAAAPPPPQAAKRRGGWPKGKSRKRGPGRPRLDADTAAAKREARRLRINETARLRRAKRAAAATRNGDNGAGNGNGSTKAVAAEVTPAQFWGHASMLAPTKPWRFVALELGVNEQQSVDCHRNHAIPPGLTAAAIQRFLELAPA